MWIERSWDEPECFGAVFDAHYAEIHRYVSRRLGPHAADGRGTIQRQVLFDQRTGELLGSRDILLEPGPDSEKWQVTGRVLDYWAIVDSGWTDARPVLPR
ncbi:hypothetical protein ACFYUK_31310 [Nonomuraea wenchangensis]